MRYVGYFYVDLKEFVKAMFYNLRYSRGEQPTSLRKSLVK